jgi:hypothetical protein
MTIDIRWHLELTVPGKGLYLLPYSVVSRSNLCCENWLPNHWLYIGKLPLLLLGGSAGTMTKIAAYESIANHRRLAGQAVDCRPEVNDR